MVIRQGDVYWTELPAPVRSEPGYRHPVVVVQNSLFNLGLGNTVIVCGVTSNLRRAETPGTVLLEPGEGSLPKQSVVNVSQLFTVDKLQLGERIGRLSVGRVRQILDGICLWLEPRELDSESARGT